MHVDNWIERDFLSYFAYHYKDGTVDRSLVFLGVHLLIPKGQLNLSTYRTGFFSSLYHTVAISGPPTDDLIEDVKRTKCFPFLKLLLGRHVENEEPDDQSAYNTTVNGKRYTIQRVQRWTSYKHFRKWLSIKGTRDVAYIVTSKEDTELPTHSFAAAAWIDECYTPSPEQIIHQAKKCWALTQQLRNDLEAMGFKKRPTEEDKDAQ